MDALRSAAAPGADTSEWVRSLRAAEDEKRVDFSTPYFDSGLQIMVRAQAEGRFLSTFHSIPWAAIGELFGVAFLVVLLLANVLWLVERRTNPRFRKKYLPAIGEGMWGSMLIIATGEYGDRDTPYVIKRIAVVAMWVLGVVLVAQLTATVTSSQTVARLQSEIRGPGDLPGKTIAAAPGTIAGDYLTRLGLPFTVLENPDHGIQMLMQGEVQTAFAAVRPPGHHASPTVPGGFCLINNVAVAARHAQARHLILEKRLDALRRFAETTSLNHLERRTAKLGFIGTAWMSSPWL